MKRTVFLGIMLTILFFIAGCDQQAKQENQQLKEQVSSLTQENDNLKNAVANLQKENESLKGMTTPPDSSVEGLSKTTLMMFIPKFGKDTFVVSFTGIQQNGSAIEGTFKTPATDPIRFTDGSINKVKDGYEFSIVVPSEAPNMVFKGKILPAPASGYEPTDSWEKNVVNMLKTNEVKILYIIKDGSVYSKGGFPPIKQTTFKNATGIVFIPQQ